MQTENAEKTDMNDELLDLLEQKRKTLTPGIYYFCADGNGSQITIEREEYPSKEDEQKYVVTFGYIPSTSEWDKSKPNIGLATMKRIERKMDKLFYSDIREAPAWFKQALVAYLRTDG